MVIYHPNSHDYLPPPFFGRLTPSVHWNQIHLIIGLTLNLRRLSLWQEGGSQCEISLKFLNNGKRERSMKAISGSLVFFQDQLSCAMDIYPNVEKVHIEPPSAGSGG